MNVEPAEINWERLTSHINPVKNVAYIFRVFVDDYHTRIKNLTGVLSVTELEKASRYARKEDRESYLSRRIALKDILSKFIATHPAKIEFLLMGNKKPYLKGIEFNISHSENQIIIAVASSPLGVDIEHINENFKTESMLSSIFTSDEIFEINHSSRPILYFYKLWTRKEALLKASGEGLVDNLAQISVLPNTIQRQEIQFMINSFMSGNDYVFSVAVSPDISKLAYFNY